MSFPAVRPPAGAVSTEWHCAGGDVQGARVLGSVAVRTELAGQFQTLPITAARTWHAYSPQVRLLAIGTSGSKGDAVRKHGGALLQGVVPFGARSASVNAIGASVVIGANRAGNTGMVCCNCARGTAEKDGIFGL